MELSLKLFEDETVKEAFAYSLEKKPSCFSCGLYRNVKSPMMNWSGEGRRKALIIAEAPGREEDEEGLQLVGESGNLLHDDMQDIDLDLYADFWRINSVNCRPTKNGENRTPTKTEVKFCRPMIFNAIRELKPQFIIPMGTTALYSLFMDHFSSKELTMDRWRGLCIPDQLLGSYIIPVFHPSDALRSDYKVPKNKNFRSLFKRDLQFVKNCLNKPPVAIEKKPKIQKLTDIQDIITYLELVNEEAVCIYLDFETTGLKPYRRGHKIVAASIYPIFKRPEYVPIPSNPFSFPLAYKDHWTPGELQDITSSLVKILKNPGIKVQAHNLKFEDSWSKVILNALVKGWDWDSMIAAHIIDSRKKFTGLKFQTYINFGIFPYDKEIASYLIPTGTSEFNRIEQVSLDKLLEYVGLDTYYGKKLTVKQKSFLFRPENKGLLEAYKFFHKGIIEFSEIQDNGIPINEKYYNEKFLSLGDSIDNITQEILESTEAIKFKNIKGRSLNIGSPKDMSFMVYNILKETPRYTSKDNLSTDKTVLERVKKSFTTKVLRKRKLEKIRGTYLANFMREVYKGKMHSLIDLHIPRSYRSSVSRPNFQNIPVRDEESREITRRGIIPSRGNQLLEVDYSGIEVCISGCYHKDPNFLNYIRDKNTDMHRDTAADLWILPVSEITKDIRFYTKNKWVFAQFYGSYYGNCAPDVWNESIDFKTASGIKLIDHIRKKGIEDVRGFTEHCKRVESIFWNERFPVYQEWKDEINEFFRQNGYIETFMGFRCRGNLSYNDASNHQIQGTAFHCLLWSLIEIQKVARRERWKTKTIGQIHDSILFDLHPSERDHVIRTVNYIATQKIRETFDWIIVPLELEYEIAPIDKSWAEKEEFKLAA